MQDIDIHNTRREPHRFPSCLLAESEGFKPPIPERGIPDFESSAFDHSANFPLFLPCKGNTLFLSHQYFAIIFCEKAD